MCVDQAWKVACASHWTSLEASVVCQQIGFSEKGNDDENQLITCHPVYTHTHLQVQGQCMYHSILFQEK